MIVLEKCKQNVIHFSVIVLYLNKNIKYKLVGVPKLLIDLFEDILDKSKTLVKNKRQYILLLNIGTAIIVVCGK